MKTHTRQQKVKSAMKILTSKDPRVKLVAEFHKQCAYKKRASIITDAIKYASELLLKFTAKDGSFEVTYTDSNEQSITTHNMSEIKNELQRRQNSNHEQLVLEATWQGVNFKTRSTDETLAPGCFDWLKTWRSAPSDVIRKIHSLYTQTLSTKTFMKTRSNNPPVDDLCRLCFSGQESVKHILNRCPVLLKHAYTKRHDKALRCFMFELLYSLHLIESCPPWFSTKEVKPVYENEVATVWWNLPEYSTGEETNDKSTYIPDGKVLLKAEKEIFIIEHTVCWIDIREARLKEKENKYVSVKCKCLA